MSTGFDLNLQPRDAFGTAASRRLRREGKVPVVIYGAGKDNVNAAVDHDELFHKLRIEAFQSALIDLKGVGDSGQAILRDVQVHAYKPRILHVDLQRVSATEKIHISVPIHFADEEEAPGVKVDAGIISHMINEVDISCLPKDLPEYLEIDASGLGMNESLHLSDIKVPEGVEITALTREDAEDLAVIAILPPKIEIEEELETVEGEELEGVEGEEEGAEEGEAPAAEDSGASDE